MSPILVVVAVFVVLLACGVAYDLKRRRLNAGRRDIGLSAELPAASPTPTAR
jgi:hypothetical protein